jgi:hypothetical protein
MAKPGAQMPDSLDPAPPESADKVDDLLAQMAGEEIDRLLSESDDLRETRLANQSASGAASEPAIGRQLDALFSGSDDADSPLGNGNVIKREEKSAPTEPLTNTPPPPQGPAAAANVALSDDEVSQQLTDLFNDEDPKAAGQPPSITQKTQKTEKPTPIIAEAPAAATEAAPSPETEFHTESSTIDPERAELLPPPQEETSPDDDGLKLDLGPDDSPGESRPLAILLKPLQWLTSPMEACPDHLRDLIGKIALLTLFNATAVLLYVFLFRRHR